MTVTWHPRTELSTKSYLLTNGEVATQPALEESTSGRKVRIAGTTTSMFTKDLDELIFRGVETLAASKGERVWMPLDPKVEAEQRDGHFTLGLKTGTKPILHFLKNGAGNSSIVWWRFRHQTLPIEATLVVCAATERNYGGGPHPVSLTASLVMPSTYSPGAREIRVMNVATPGMEEVTRDMQRDHYLRFQEFLRDNRPNWSDDLHLSKKQLFGERVAVRQMIDLVRAADSFDEIDIPDLRDPDNPAWLRLHLHDTNLTGEFTQSMIDFLDGTSALAQVKGHYDEMTKLLRTMGVILEEKDENSFASALAGGEPVRIAVNTTPAETGHGADHKHSLVLHLPSGTMIVNCGVSQKVDKDQIATKWEEALTMASLTGQEDILLAYARRYAETAHERRAKQILAEREGLM